jgi:hypothetical protein
MHCFHLKPDNYKTNSNYSGTLFGFNQRKVASNRNQSIVPIPNFAANEANDDNSTEVVGSNSFELNPNSTDYALITYVNSLLLQLNQMLNQIEQKVKSQAGFYSKVKLYNVHSLQAFVSERQTFVKNYLDTAPNWFKSAQLRSTAAMVKTMLDGMNFLFL